MTGDILGRGTAHHTLPGGDLSIDTANCTSTRVNTCGAERYPITIDSEIVSHTAEHDDIDDAEEIVWAAIQRAYAVDRTAEVRAMLKAREEAEWAL